MSMRERRKAVINLDVRAARLLSTFSASGIRDDEIRIALHKLRYEMPDAPRELRHESGAWLRERGYGRMTGEPLLLEGELP